ncbi:MAG TPA: preprotein translocase subunit SecE [Candidatus Babeliales bacterium]|nr:preprotein translocase subunit SecE [Candidatus Babeliales bacterium]
MSDIRIKSWLQFFQEVRIELAKMIWPKWNEFIGATTVVFLLILAFSIYLGGVDFGLNYLMNSVFNKIFGIG